MYDFLKQLAEDNNWPFEYSRKDYQNLFEVVSGDTPHLFVDPIVIDSTFSKLGNETRNYSGKMMLLLSSDIDETYEDKYADYIRPLINGAAQVLKDELSCSIFEIKKFQCMEVINLYDANLDGLLITYSVTELD